MRIFVTGAGGPAGVNVVRELASSGHMVVAGDCDPTAAGFHLADRNELLPRSDEDGFVDVLLGILVAHDIDVLISTVVDELVLLDDVRGELAAIGVGHWAPTAASLAVCADKLAFASALERAGVATPATSAGSGRTVPGPWIVKPREGRGSRDVHAVDTRAAVRAARTLTPGAIVQTRIDGREFSVDALIDHDGTVLGSAARWRDACRGGISTAGTTFHHSGVDDAVQAAVRAAELTGPANVQGFVTTSGGVVIVEINPRFSGALPLSIASGCDLVGQFLVGATGGRPDPERLQSRPGVVMTRVFEEIFVTGDPIGAL